VLNYSVAGLTTPIAWQLALQGCITEKAICGTIGRLKINAIISELACTGNLDFYQN
jgi:hypothetical protein